MNRGYSSLWCMGFSLWWLLLWSSGSRHADFSSCGFWAVECIPVIVVNRLNCSMTCGIFLNQESNLCPLLWLAYSYPLCHQGSFPPISLNGIWYLETKIWVLCMLTDTGVILCQLTILLSVHLDMIVKGATKKQQLRHERGKKEEDNQNRDSLLFH